MQTHFRYNCVGYLFYGYLSNQNIDKLSKLNDEGDDEDYIEYSNIKRSLYS